MTKTHPAGAVDHAARYGLAAVGENRVQEGVEKRALSAAAIRWELISTSQSKQGGAGCLRPSTGSKASTASNRFTLLDRAAGETGKILAILLQVNVGPDPPKFKCRTLRMPPRLLAAAAAKPHLKVGRHHS